MQIVNIRWTPDGYDDLKGCDNLFLVDVPDTEFDGLMLELEDALSSYWEHVDGADTPSPDKIAETVMAGCGRHYIPIDRVGTIKM